MMKCAVKKYSTLLQALPLKNKGEEFFEKLRSIKNEEEKISFAADYVSSVYGFDKTKFIIPKQGEQNFTFIMKDCVIRLARYPNLSKNMGNEIDAMRTLKGYTSSQIPSVLDFQPDKHIMSISRLSGEPLSIEKFEAFSESTQKSLLKRVGQFLGEMHNCFPTTEEIEKPWWKEKVLRKIEARLKHEIYNDKRIRLQKAVEYTKEYGKKKKEPFVMCHGDMIASNIIYDEQNDSLGFIDFTSVEFGAAHRDFFKLRCGLSKELYDVVVSAYEKTTGNKIDQNEVNAALDCYCIILNDPLIEISPARMDRVKNTRDRLVRPS